MVVWSPAVLRDVFGDVFRQVQRGKALEPFVFYAGAYLLSLDGTGYFSSPTIHCDACQVKEHKDGSVTYQHQMLGAVIVHPDIKGVIPLAPEPIQKHDGHTKNDCERNAAKRLLPRIRQQHPHLKFIVIEDGLASNGPHVRDLLDNGKLGSKRALWDHVRSLFCHFRIHSMRQLYEALLYDLAKAVPLPGWDTS